MAVVVELIFVALVSLCIIRGRLADCSISDISVSQSSTGKTVNGKPEYDEVVISNRCICSQSSLKLSCPGFNTVEAVDSKLFRTDGGDLCVVNDNQPVYKDQSIKFKYAWDSQCAISPSASKVNCS